MKKLSLLLVLTVLFSHNVKAENAPFVAFDINRNTVTHHYTHENGNKTNNDGNFGYGLSAGYNFDFGKVSLAPEIFYDKINTANKSYLCPSGGQHYCKDKMEVDSRYGAKLNLGYEVAQNTKLFINAGYSNVKVDQKYLNGYTAITTGRVLVKTNKNGVFTYGFGASYTVNNNIALKAAYEISQFSVIHQDYLSPNPIDEIKLQIVKLGLIYSF